jgi:hypothetical protein
MTPPGSTSTGLVLEQMVLPALAHGGYSSEKPRTPIGTRLGGGRHFVDLVVQKPGAAAILVSLKWQQTSGTAEQKVPFEVMCLADAIRSSKGAYERAYLVLGGDGWSLRDFYVGGGLTPFLNGCEAVSIVAMEAFVAKANKGQI